MAVPNAFGGETMKKTMVYVIALTLVLSTFLAGCGEMRGSDDRSTLPSATPQQTLLPETMMPNPEDGVVRDNDGIITDNDTGSTTGNTTHVPEGSAQPDTGTVGASKGNGTGNTMPSTKR